MADQNPKEQDVPSFEDVQKELGMDAMSFMSDMLRQPEPKEE
jgi:hypothetical protein